MSSAQESSLRAHVDTKKATIVYCVNISTVYLSENPVHHRRTKHVELDIHFIRELVAVGELCVVHVPTDLQYANIMTKGLPTAIFNKFKSSLQVIDSTHQTVGGC
jgi:hypothetical protein